MTRNRRNRLRSRRKRSRINRIQSLLFSRGTLLSLAVLVPVSIFAAWTAFGRDRQDDAGEPERSAYYSAAAPAQPPSTAAQQTVTVQNIPLTGLDRDRAKDKLTAAFAWNISIEYENDHYPVPNLLDVEIERILNEIYTDSPAAGQAYAFDYEGLREGAQKAAADFAARFDRSPENSQLVAYDRETGKYQYSKEVNGLKLDQEQLAEAILTAVKSGNLDAAVTPSFSIIPADRDQARAKELYQVIGTFTTKTTNNQNRNQNIRLAVDAIDGRVLKPGEEFSFNLSTGNRTSEKGYQPAGAYKNGVLIEEPGGGVCQVSTTLYHAIINSGFMTTERNSHSFAPGYVEPGQDAMVSFDGYAGPDLKFVNTSKASIALRAAFRDNTLKLSIVGLPVLEDGVKVSIRSEQVGETAPPEPVVEENQNLPFGTRKEVDSAKKGASWKSFRVLTKDGQVLEEKPLHNSNYRPKAAVIQQNTTAPEQTTPEVPAQTQEGQAIPEVPAQNESGQAIPEVPAQTQAGQAIPEIPAQNESGQTIPVVPAQNKTGQTIPEVPAQNETGQTIPEVLAQTQAGQPPPVQGVETTAVPVQGAEGQKAQGAPAQVESVPDVPVQS